jgi:hypothetical protein
MIMGSPPADEIPLFIAAYTGWKNRETIQEKLDSQPNISGILVIETGMFLSSSKFGGMFATGPLALWALICCLHNTTNSLQSASTNPINYAI